MFLWRVATLWLFRTCFPWSGRVGLRPCKSWVRWISWSCWEDFRTSRYRLLSWQMTYNMTNMTNEYKWMQMTSDIEFTFLQPSWHHHPPFVGDPFVASSYMHLEVSQGPPTPAVPRVVWLGVRWHCHLMSKQYEHLPEIILIQFRHPLLIDLEIVLQSLHIQKFSLKLNDKQFQQKMTLQPENLTVAQASHSAHGFAAAVAEWVTQAQHQNGRGTLGRDA